MSEARSDGESSTQRTQTFTASEVRDLYLSAYEDGVAAGYLDGERDGHDRALREHLALLPDDAFEPRIPGSAPINSVTYLIDERSRSRRWLDITHS
jgi:hypothetical protein